ncbi:MAG: MFS transporter, partial [Clostridiales bacterium]|nr:MFS transporter [Clostridiales bacterium]
MIAGFAKAVPLLVIFTALKGLFSSPMTGTLNAVIADTAQYTFLKEGKRLEGTMYSSASVGIKVGGGLGSAIGGWLLTLGGYNGKLQVQPDGAL